MARCCDITGKKTANGNHVSHSNRKVKRTFKPNIQAKSYWLRDPKTNQLRRVKLKLSTKAIRLIDKIGLERVLEKYVEN